MCPGPAIAAADAASPAEPYNGDPPFTYHGGPLMGTTSAVTVTPIYWAPGAFGYSTNYQSLTGRFIGDAAHDSELTTDVFSVLEQYTDAGSNHFLNDLSAGAAITDTDPYPASGGCTADTGEVYADGSGYSACVTDAEIQTELSTVLSAHGLPTGLGHLYVVFLAKGVESCITTANEAGGGDCTVSAASTGSNSFCSYHSAFGTQANPTVYDDIPYAVSDSPSSGFTCSSDAGSLAGGGLVGNQSPNGNLAADTSISLTSHEMSEAFTDPEESAWYDGAADPNEIADDCAYIFGDSSTYLGPAGAEYNETINGDHYFIQEEFSNSDFAANKANACRQGVSWTVTFNANGGTGSMAAETESSPAALTANAFTRAGFTFTGWNTAANGSGTAYPDQAVYPFTITTTLYAQWSPANATVTFNANGGTGSMAAETESTPTALTANAFTRAGFTFAGWNTAANGSGIALRQRGDLPVHGLGDAVCAVVGSDLHRHVQPERRHREAWPRRPRTSRSRLTPNSFTRAGYTFSGLEHGGERERHRLRRPGGLPVHRLGDDVCAMGGGDLHRHLQRERWHRQHGGGDGERPDGPDRERLHPLGLHLQRLEHRDRRQRHGLSPTGRCIRSRPRPPCMRSGVPAAVVAAAVAAAAVRARSS